MILQPLSGADDIVAAVCQLEASTSRTPWTPGVVASELRSGLRRYVGATNPCPTSRRCETPHVTSPQRAGEHRADLVGFAGFAPLADEAHLMEIVVHPAWQHQGVGRALLGWLYMSAAELGCTSMTLEVRADDERARRIYVESGFTEVGARPGYYPDGQAAVIATRQLQVAAVVGREA